MFRGRYSGRLRSRILRIGRRWRHSRRQRLVQPRHLLAIDHSMHGCRTGGGSSTAARARLNSSCRPSSAAIRLPIARPSPCPLAMCWAYRSRKAGCQRPRVWTLFGEAQAGWEDSGFRSQLRRLVAKAEAYATVGYRRLLMLRRTPSPASHRLGLENALLQALAVDRLL